MNVHPPSPSPLTLHQFGACARSKSVRIVLHCKGLPFHAIETPLLGRWRLRRLSGQAWPPVLLAHDGRVIVHASRIVRYLEGVAPEVPLFPNGPEARDRDFATERFAENELHLLGVALKYLNPRNHRAALASVACNYRDGYNAALLPLLPLAQRLRLSRFGIRARDLDELRRRFRDAFETFERALQENPYLIGPVPTCADVRIYAVLWALRGCEEVAALADLSGLGAWFRRLEDEHGWDRA